VLTAAACINFEPAIPVQVSPVEAARSVDAVFGDVTGDGADDVVVAVTVPETDVIVRMAPCGDGCLERREEIWVGDTVQDLAVADVDGDGTDDVAVASFDRQTGEADVRVFFGSPAATGRPEGLVADDSVVAAADPFFGGWDQVAADDLDGDGDIDLALAGGGRSGGGRYDYVAGDGDGDGDGGFAPPREVLFLSSRQSLTGLAVGDVTGDGQHDLVVSIVDFEFTSHLLVYENGTTQAWRHSATDGLFEDLAVGDIDGDGIDDVAVTTNFGGFLDPNVRLLRSTGTAFSGFGDDGAVTSVAEDGSEIALRDIDLDGHVDLLATSDTGLRWWHGTGNGAFIVPIRRDAGPNPRNLELDTRSGAPGPDLLVTNSTAPFAQVSYLVNASRLPE
jgi:hypothetical protein